MKNENTGNGRIRIFQNPKTIFFILLYWVLRRFPTVCSIGEDALF